MIVLAGAALCGLAVSAGADSRDGRYGDTDIFVVNVDGTGHRNLTGGKGPAQRVLRAHLARRPHARLRPSPPGRRLRLLERRPLARARRFGSSTDPPPRCQCIRRRMVARRTADRVRDVLRRAPGRRHGKRRTRWRLDPGWGGADLAQTQSACVLDGRRGFRGQDIALTHSDGTSRRVLVRAEDVSLSYVFGPAASPDSRRILFTAADNYTTRIYSMRVSPATLPEAVAEGRDPSWSPKSRRIVFVRSEGPNASLASVGADGTGPKRFSTTRGFQPVLPSWSPDGRRIAFISEPISEPEGSARLVVLNLRRGSLRVVARGVARQQPLWAPDGRRLYYAAPHTS